LLFFALVVDFGKVYLAAGEVQKALDAAALAGANTMSVWVEIDRYGHIYGQTVMPDPVRADADARSTFQANTQLLNTITVKDLSVAVEGSKVTVSATFEVPTSLIAAWASVPPKITLTRRASADCLVTMP